MFARISLVRFDPERMEEAQQRWLTVSVPAAKARKGCRNMRGFRSLEEPGLMIIVSEWDSQEDSDAYLYSPEHEEMIKGYGTLIKAMEGRYPCVLIE
jgi:quinol monooxygenase YgiN